MGNVLTTACFLFVCLLAWFVCLFVCLVIWLVGWFEKGEELI